MIITIVLIAINVFIYFLPIIYPFAGNARMTTEYIQSLYAKVNLDINDGEYYRLVTANFLHADIIHLLVNMFSLYQVGPSVQNIYSSFGYILIFILSGIGGAFFSYLFNQSPSLGASGAIFGLVGAIFAYALITGNRGLISQLMFIVFLNFSISLSPNSRIDNWGHLGGLLTGAILGSILLFTKF